MQNVKTEIKKDTLVITVDLSQRNGDSKSGKSITIASSGGNEPLGNNIFLGINVYLKRSTAEYAKWRKDHPEAAE